MKELRALTGFRFIAAAYVFIFHLYERGFFPPLPWFIKNILDEGALGVNAFFVLSGLLLTYSHLKDYPVENFKGIKYAMLFLLKRIARIYPVLLIGLIFNALFSFIFNNQPTNFKYLFLLCLTLINAWVPSKTLIWYGGSWSVSSEMFFYIVFVFMLPYLLRIKNTRLLFLVLIMSICLASIPGLYYNSLIKGRVFDQDLYSWFYVFPPARLPEFVCGCITAVLVFRNGWQIPAWVATTAIAFGALYLVKFGPAVLGHVGHNRIILPIILLIVAHLTQPRVGLAFRWLASDIAVYLGRISYGFYIWQIVALDIPSQFWLSFFKVNNYFVCSFLIFISILLAAIISYHLIEKPIHSRLIKLIYTTPIFSKNELNKKITSHDSIACTTIKPLKKILNMKLSIFSK